MIVSEVESLVSAVESALGSHGPAVGEAPDSDIVFTLFNGSNSICSQKVRAVLAHHGISYFSNSMNMFRGETYLPDYVRLRLIGCRAVGLPLVTTHTGSTSMTHGGCDPAVVPTLIDWRDETVIVDSHRICRHIDALIPKDRSLIPAELADRVEAEMDVIDDLPNYQMLAGRPPEVDMRPPSMRDSDGAALASAKVRRCEDALEANADDPELVAAYRAKRAKESAAATRLFGTGEMRVVYASAQRVIDDLERKRTDSIGPFLLGERVTMADLFWGIALLRMENLGADVLWLDGRHVRVQSYLDAVRDLPALRSAVTDWPGATF